MRNNFPVKETVIVAVIYLLLSFSLLGTFLAPLKLSVYFLGETQDSGVWSKLTTRRAEISYSKIDVDIAL